MKRWYALAVALVVAISVASYAVGKWATRAHDNAFDFELAALVLTGLGTTALAAMTGLLALLTWKPARDERARRPVLSLAKDEEPRVYSQVESDGWPYIRMRVGNQAGLRPAAGARVLVDRYWPTGYPKQVESLGSAPLGWTSSGHEGAYGAVTVFAGTQRVFDLGSLMRPDPNDPAWRGWEKAPKSWWLRLGLHGVEVDRQFLLPSSWTMRLVVGSDEAEARFYEVSLSWAADALDAARALDSAVIDITELSAEAFGALVEHEREAENG